MNRPALPIAPANRRLLVSMVWRASSKGMGSRAAIDGALPGAPVS